MNADPDWTRLELAEDVEVAVQMSFFRAAPVSERLIITRAERRLNGNLHVNFSFDRTFSTQMERSPDHLTPIGLLLLAQKLLYYLLCAQAGFDPSDRFERFKLWPVSIDIRIPRLVVKREGVEGELFETSRHAVHAESHTLYPGVDAICIKGKMVIEKTMEYEIECFVYDFGEANTSADNRSS